MPLKDEHSGKKPYADVDLSIIFDLEKDRESRATA
jgi:hypothetical protein